MKAIEKTRIRIAKMRFVIPLDELRSIFKKENHIETALMKNEFIRERITELNMSFAMTKPTILLKQAQHLGRILRLQITSRIIRSTIAITTSM